MGIPQHGWFTTEIPKQKWMITGVPLWLRKPPNMERKHQTENHPAMSHWIPLISQVHREGPRPFSWLCGHARCHLRHGSTGHVPRGLWSSHNSLGIRKDNHTNHIKSHQIVDGWSHYVDKLMIPIPQRHQIRKLLESPSPAVSYPWALDRWCASAWTPPWALAWTWSGARSKNGVPGP